MCLCGCTAFVRPATAWLLIPSCAEGSYACCVRRAISPLCISVPLLEAGLEEGRTMVMSVFGPSADTQHSGAAATESHLEEAAAAGAAQVV